MVVTEVNNKNWLKPDQSKMEENLTEKDPKAHCTIIIMKTDSTSRRRAQGDECWDTVGTDNIRNKMPSQPKGRDRIWHHKVKEQPTLGNT